MKLVTSCISNSLAKDCDPERLRLKEMVEFRKRLVFMYHSIDATGIFVVIRLVIEASSYQVWEGGNRKT
jgi:hypothetical protein